MFQKILVPLDGSKLAENALGPAEVLAKQFNAEVILFHAISYATIYTDIEQPEGICTICEVDDKQKAVVERYLSKAAGELNSKGIKTSWDTRLGERVPTLIIDYAREKDVSLIVMSTCGRSGSYPGVMGSVADRVSKGGTEAGILLICPKTAEKLCAK
jgi:nucleotide-binding universal stress UspA family protein